MTYEKFTSMIFTSHQKLTKNLPKNNWKGFESLHLDEPPAVYNELIKEKFDIINSFLSLSGHSLSGG